MKLENVERLVSLAVIVKGKLARECILSKARAMGISSAVRQQRNTTTCACEVGSAETSNRQAPPEEGRDVRICMRAMRDPCSHTSARNNVQERLRFSDHV